MELVRDLSELDPRMRGGCVTVGNFDGVHRGHLRILSTVRRVAEKVGGPSVVFTFDPHPLTLLRPELAPPALTWVERKMELLTAQGVDLLVAYPTDRALLELSDQAFFESILRTGLGAAGIVEGPNFRFGRGRMGDVTSLARFCQAAGLALEIVQGVNEGTTLVSSTRIREWIASGDVRLANQWLTAPYRLRGVVAHGDKRGRELGFPTANLVGCDTLVPAPGVYVGATEIQGERFRAAIHVGPNVTFGQDDPRIEA
ncbi:MAG: bifunctional riboflavin kinase/FAD synthetase, partial [Planctomycetales bacterium]|nr:bifunctional riboflavin kinase/FAD synthetase [Planctomycetales bacterium]